MIHNKQLTVLMAGHAAKHYGLPSELVRLVETRTALDSARREVRTVAHAVPSATRAEGAGGRDAFTAFLETGELPQSIEAPVLEASSERARLAARERVLVAAVQAADAELDSFFVRHADDVIAEHLQPALTACLDGAGKAAAALGGIADPAAAIRSGDKQARAWRNAEGLAEQYRALRDAQNAILGLRPLKPRDPYLAEFRVHGGLWLVSDPEVRTDVLPTEPVARLLVVATQVRHQTWLPTLQQQDAQSADLARQQEQAARNEEKEPASA